MSANLPKRPFSYHSRQQCHTPVVPTLQLNLTPKYLVLKVLMGKLLRLSVFRICSCRRSAPLPIQIYLESMGWSLTPFGLIPTSNFKLLTFKFSWTNLWLLKVGRFLYTPVTATSSKVDPRASVWSSSVQLLALLARMESLILVRVVTH